MTIDVLASVDEASCVQLVSLRMRIAGLKVRWRVRSPNGCEDRRGVLLSEILSFWTVWRRCLVARHIVPARDAEATQSAVDPCWRHHRNHQINVFEPCLRLQEIPNTHLADSQELSCRPNTRSWLWLA